VCEVFFFFKTCIRYNPESEINFFFFFFFLAPPTKDETRSGSQVTRSRGAVRLSFLYELHIELDELARSSSDFVASPFATTRHCSPDVVRPSAAADRFWKSAAGLVVKFIVANDVPRVRFPGGATFIYSILFPAFFRL
jgi:hypothetical protein